MPDTIHLIGGRWLHGELITLTEHGYRINAIAGLETGGRWGSDLSADMIGYTTEPREYWVPTHSVDYIAYGAGSDAA